MRKTAQCAPYQTEFNHCVGKRSNDFATVYRIKEEFSDGHEHVEDVNDDEQLERWGGRFHHDSESYYFHKVEPLS